MYTFRVRRVFLGAFSILLFWGYFRVARNDTFVSIWGLCPQTPASGIYFCRNYRHLSTPNFQTLRAAYADNTQTASEKPSGHVEVDRPLRYKSWNAENMMRAIKAVQKNQCTIRETSEIYKVPKSTLHNRISGKVIHGTCSGPECYLTDTEENSLIKFLRKCCSIGFARSKK